jgi:hypothetical protein
MSREVPAARWLLVCIQKPRGEVTGGDGRRVEHHTGPYHHDPLHPMPRQTIPAATDAATPARYHIGRSGCYRFSCRIMTLPNTYHPVWRAAMRTPSAQADTQIGGSTRGHRRQASITQCDLRFIGSEPSADFVLCGGPRSWWPTHGRSTGYAWPRPDGYRVLAGEWGLQRRSGKAMSQRHTNVPPPEFFVGDVAADVAGAHEPAVLVQRLGQGALPAAAAQPGDEQAVGGGPGCSSPMARTGRWRTGAVGST